MRNPYKLAKHFIKSLGPVEQAQVVGSTAVVVTMATIIAAMFVTGETVRLMDFISIVAVGTIGFTSVYFSLRYSRQLDEQRRQLLALNTIAEAVNREVEINNVLQTALMKATELLGARYGWIYMLEGTQLRLKSSKGTTLDFLTLASTRTTPISAWLHQPRVQRERLQESHDLIDEMLKQMGIQFWASIPLRAKDTVAGSLIIAGNDFEMFTSKQAELMETFGNQISVALHNAQLFERLKQSERRYANLYEQSPDIYLSVDHQHCIVGCNETGADLLGFTKEDIIGQPFENLFVEHRRDKIHSDLARMFAEGRGLKDGEEQIVMKDGRIMYVSLNSSLDFEDKGSSTHARIVARDISERKLMESALLHAQKIDSIGNLAGGVAHDFNNILASILGAASIIRRRVSEKGKLYKYVEIIESASRRGSSLTRQLLTFARKTETLTKPVDINSIIKETLEMFERSVSKEIVTRTVLTDEATQVHGDDGQIQQALLNLFLNARDAMPNGGTLSIETSVTTADAHTPSQFFSVKSGLFILIKVSDTGIGITKEIQNRVFEPFFTTKDHGTGLGLSVLYGVVQNHGGFINLESEVGLGSTFYVYLPRATILIRAKGHQRPKRLPRGRENILIIDDERSVCEIAHDMLSDLGYNVIFANDGKDGVDLYRTRQASIDLILLDMNMPIMGGREAFEQLRTINPNLHIIIMTGYGKGILDAPTFSSDVDGFLQKPFELDDLALKVRLALDRRTADSHVAT
jgi:PAS domain S-box-containing protein